MRILVLGASGFLGSAVWRALSDHHVRLTTVSNLTSAEATYDAVGDARPDAVINCAALCGGIQFAGQNPAALFRVNTRMMLNVFDACVAHSVKRLVNPIANCVYPGSAIVFEEARLWEGAPHETVRAYASTKRGALDGAWAYRKQFGLDTASIVLGNMYGPGDHFDEARSHALGALVGKMVRAKAVADPFVTVWGTGTPIREWLYVDEGAEALIRAIEMPSHDGPVNVSGGGYCSIGDLACAIRREVGYEGELRFDTSKPDGANCKTINGELGKSLMGWAPGVGIQDGIARTVAWVKEHPEALR